MPVRRGRRVPRMMGRTQSTTSPVPALADPRANPALSHASAICRHGPPGEAGCALSGTVGPMTRTPIISKPIVPGTIQNCRIVFASGWMMAGDPEMPLRLRRLDASSDPGSTGLGAFNNIKHCLAARQPRRCPRP
jgi:hypothetical protein